jgi:tRNA A-37 threonylcarbamoyl transferase component Bud32
MLTNQQIQNYKLISLIGEGGMGDVYLAEHISIQRKAAIKVLKPELAKSEEIRQRFKNEASMLANLQHPHIVGLIDYVEQDGNLYLIMEYVEGKGLDELIQEQATPISIDRARKLMIQIVEAFAYAHRNGIVHRDVKPSNILVTTNDQIKVLDFGIAKLVGEGKHHLTKTGTQMGTVFYMSPEQVRGQILDSRSDIYSLGVTFYELFSGVCPYKSMTTEYEIYDSIVKQPLLDLTKTMGSEYSSMWRIIQKATAKELNERYQTCDELLKDLKSDHVETPKFTETKRVEAAKPSIMIIEQPKKKKTLLVVLSLVLLGALSISMWYFSQSDPAEEGERLAAVYCDCQKQNNEEYLSRLEGFVQNFDGQNYVYSSDAEKALKQLSNEYIANTFNTTIMQCYKKANDEKEKMYLSFGSESSEGVKFIQTYDDFILKNLQLIDQKNKIAILKSKASEKIATLVYDDPNALKLRKNSILLKLNNFYNAYSGGYLDAMDYFAYQVEQFIYRKNLTPSDINLIVQEETDFQSPVFKIYSETINLVSSSDGVETWEYLAEFQCYRPSKEKYQISNVLYEIKIEQSGKFTSYKEKSVRQNKFVYPEDYNSAYGNEQSNESDW